MFFPEVIQSHNSTPIVEAIAIHDPINDREAYKKGPEDE
jgi:hypothetical protein